VIGEALAMARVIADNAPFAVRETKRAIYRGLAIQKPQDAAREEAHYQAMSVTTEDAREGIDALLTKRKPVFTGR